MKIPLGHHKTDTFRKENFACDSGQGIRSVKSGTIEADIIIEIDPAKLRSYCIKALSNRAGASRLAHGGIIFRATNLKATPN